MNDKVTVLRGPLEVGIDMHERMLPNNCPECARSWGPNYIGPCDHGLLIKPVRRKAPTYATEQQILDAAKRIIERRYITNRQVMRDPNTVRQFLQTWIGGSDIEKFGLIFLDNQHRAIATEILSTGTVDGASVYSREVVKAAIKHNAAAVILAHNHPSGVAEPSAADRSLTERLKTALNAVDIRVLDHFVVGAQIVSFAERGWI